jgi:hypothetical protein
MFVSGVGNPLNHSTVVLASRDGGNTWSTADSWAPPQTGNIVNFPGGIIGCPTHPLTPAPGGNPQPGLEAAAFQYIRSQRHWDPTAAATYPVNGSNPKGSYGDLFKFQLASCGQATMQNAWVVEVAGVPGQGGGGSTSQAQLALSHSADGWHVFGFYH